MRCTTGTANQIYSGESGKNIKYVHMICAFIHHGDFFFLFWFGSFVFETGEARNRWYRRGQTELRWKQTMGGGEKGGVVELAKRKHVLEWAKEIRYNKANYKWRFSPHRAENGKKAATRGEQKNPLSSRRITQSSWKNDVVCVWVRVPCTSSRSKIKQHTNERRRESNNRNNNDIDKVSVLEIGKT